MSWTTMARTRWARIGIIELQPFRRRFRDVGPRRGVAANLVLVVPIENCGLSKKLVHWR
jgi:hypothetical protein